MIYAPWNFPIDEYPAIRAHLELFKAELGAHPEVRQGRFPWYALSRYGSEFAHEFDRPKIVYPDIANRCEFGFDQVGRYGGNTIYFIGSDDPYLLGVLNASLTEFLYRRISASIRGGFMRFFSPYLAELPIPNASPAERRAIERLVRRLLALRGEGEEAAALERELNERVYRLFGLAKAEIALIKGSLGRATAR